MNLGKKGFRGRRLLNTICSVFIGVNILLPAGIFEAAMGKKVIEVDELIRSVLSQDCETRYKAVLSFIESADLGSLPFLGKELQRKNPQALAYLREGMEFVKFQDKIAADYEVFLRSKHIEFRRKAGIDEQKKYSEVETMKMTEDFASFFLAEVELEKSPENQLILVESLAERFRHYHPYEESRPFLAALEKLMSSQDLRKRVFAAANLSFADVKPDLRNRKVIVPILIEGLKSEDFPVRYYAQEALKRLTKVSICFNPLDFRAQRLQTIAAWQEWWKKESRKKE